VINEDYVRVCRDLLCRYFSRPSSRAYALRTCTNSQRVPFCSRGGMTFFDWAPDTRWCRNHEAAIMVFSHSSIRSCPPPWSADAQQLRFKTHKTQWCLSAVGRLQSAARLRRDDDDSSRVPPYSRGGTHLRPSLIGRLIGDARNHEAAITRMVYITHTFLAFLPFFHPIMSSTAKREHKVIKVLLPQVPVVSPRCRSLGVCSNARLTRDNDDSLCCGL
jgi:hypothetical protein